MRTELCILGGTGRLGIGLAKFFPNALRPSSKDLDIRDRQAVFSYFKKYCPRMVIHAAAATRINDCEKNKQWAWDTNVVGTQNVVDACLEYGNDRFVYVSTACVFDGERGDYSEEDVPCPCSYYGFTKVVGEIPVRQLSNAVVMRTNFVPFSRWEYPRAFSDRFGTYLFSEDVAFGLRDLLFSSILGVVHLCGDKKLSMFELAKTCPKAGSNVPDVLPMTLAEYSGPKLARDMSLVTKRWKSYKLGCGLQ